VTEPRAGRPGFDFGQGFSSSGAHPASYPVGTGGFFSGGKAAGTWSWPLPHLAPEVKKAWSCIFTPPYVFMVRYLVQIRDNFNLTYLIHSFLHVFLLSHFPSSFLCFPSSFIPCYISLRPIFLFSPSTHNSLVSESTTTITESFRICCTHNPMCCSLPQMKLPRDSQTQLLRLCHSFLTKLATQSVYS